MFDFLEGNSMAQRHVYVRFYSFKSMVAFNSILICMRKQRFCSVREDVKTSTQGAGIKETALPWRGTSWGKRTADQNGF